MANLSNIQLADYEDEDIFDIVVKLEKSFAIKFKKEAFTKVNTFGDLCDVIQSHIKYDNKEDCTKQQAFYKIRKAICETQLIDKRLIQLDTPLIDLFPRPNRRKQVNMFQKKLGVKLPLLTYPDWLALSLILGLLFSFAAFFFDWKMAVSGISFFVLSFKIADMFKKDLAFSSVKELTAKAVNEHYIDMRRSKLTANRDEILAIIECTFSEGLDISKEQLKREANFSWA